MQNTLYESDLTDLEWSFLQSLVPEPKPGGRPTSWSRRSVLNGLFYLLRSGCPWRMIPREYPPWQTLYRYFRAWHENHVWENINTCLREHLRIGAGRKRSPSAAIMDSQSSKTTESGGVRGYDGGKKVNGRKRHILVDTNGFVLKVAVHPANMQDRVGAHLLLDPLAAEEGDTGSFPHIRMLWADQGYTGQLKEWVQDRLGWQVEIAPRRTKETVEADFWQSVKQRHQDGVTGTELYAGLMWRRHVGGTMKVMPKRWVVERTFAWLGRNRRLSKDYEALPARGEAFVYLAMIRLMLKRLNKQHQNTS